MNDPYRGVFDALVAAGWKLHERAPDKALSASELWPPDLRTRYPRIPAELTAFLGRIDECVNEDDTMWFLTAENYARSSGTEWNWNAWENLELEGCGDDEEESAAVRAFWNSYVPFILDSRGDFGHFAVRVTEPPPRKRGLLWFMGEREPGMGAVVHGIEELRNVSEVAKSLPEFLKLLEARLRNPAAKGPLSWMI